MSIFFRRKAFQDNTWTSVDLISWTVVEPGCHLIVACLPALQPLFAKATTTRLGEKVSWAASSGKLPGFLGKMKSSRGTKGSRSGFVDLEKSRDVQKKASDDVGLVQMKNDIAASKGFDPK